MGHYTLTVPDDVLHRARRLAEQTARPVDMVNYPISHTNDILAMCESISIHVAFNALWMRLAKSASG